MPQIPRVINPDPQRFFEEYIVAGRPAVLVGCMDWRIVEVDPRTLLDPNKEVFVTEDDIGLNGPGHYRKTILHFGEVLRRWQSSGKRKFYYMDQQPINRLHPELLSYIGYPQMLPRELLVAVNLWMGEGRIRWHFDGVDNFLAHIHGCKSVRLIPPEKLRNMYVFGNQWCAIDDVDHVDLDAFPLAADIGETFDTVLEKGEMLFLPAGWWHTAAAVGGWAASVNFWYDTWYGVRKSVFERPFFSGLEHLTHLLAEEVPHAERQHYCRLAIEMLERIVAGQPLPMKSLGGWDNPQRINFTPVADRVPPRFPDGRGTAAKAAAISR
jgi:hypothetical protein